MNDSQHVLPENIRKNLKMYEQHRHMTCLECGYVGLVGVKKAVPPALLSWFVLIPVIVFMTFILSLGMIHSLILGTFFGLIRVIFSQYLVVCPNCEKELIGR